MEHYTRMKLVRNYILGYIEKTRKVKAEGSFKSLAFDLSNNYGVSTKSIRAILEEFAEVGHIQLSGDVIIPLGKAKVKTISQKEMVVEEDDILNEVFGK